LGRADNRRLGTLPHNMARRVVLNGLRRTRFAEALGTQGLAVNNEEWGEIFGDEVMAAT
jgi:hypothetical protein